MPHPVPIRRVRSSSSPPYPNAERARPLSILKYISLFTRPSVRPSVRPSTPTRVVHHRTFANARCDSSYALPTPHPTPKAKHAARALGPRKSVSAATPPTSAPYVARRSVASTARSTAMSYGIAAVSLVAFVVAFVVVVVVVCIVMQSVQE